MLAGPLSGRPVDEVVRRPSRTVCAAPSGGGPAAPRRGSAAGDPGGGETHAHDAIHESSDREGAPGHRNTRLLVVDDCTLYRDGLATALTFEGLTVVGTAWNLPSLALALGRDDVDLLLINISTKDSDLLLRAAMDLSSSTRVIVVGTSEDDEERIVAFAEAGVAAYHMRSDSLDDLLELISDVQQGKSICPPRVSAILLRHLSTVAAGPRSVGRSLSLTPREVQILGLLELGSSNRDIAAHLHIAVHTVKHHVHSLLAKLGVNSRVEAAALSRALRSEGLIPKD